MAIVTRDPTTGEELAYYATLDDMALEKRIEIADSAFGEWRKTTFAERAELLELAAQVLESRKDDWADLMTREMGKPKTQSVSEIEKCAWVCRFYADHAEEFLKPERRESDASESFVRYDPLGPILAVMPWNFPFWQVFRFCAPALAAGNVGLLKHASNVLGCGLAIEEILREAGFPRGCFQTLIIPSSQVESVIADGRVRAATLTGSEAAGRDVAQAAGRQLKKIVLELGGSDPYVVLEDADVSRAIEVAVTSRTINAGQSCIAAKRFIVHQNHLERFEAEMKERMESLEIGDPREKRTQVGPLAREDLADELQRQVDESVQRGARLLCGGKRLEGPGNFYVPTVLGDVLPGMPVADEETFGPVAAILSATDDDDAVDLANRTRYGLGASVWTEDTERAKEIAGRIEAGCVFINGLVKSDPRLPFGGVKASGHGRELSREGIREFTNAKTVWVA